MKIFNKFMILAGLAVAGVACEADPESFTPGAQDPEGCAGVYFAEDYNTVIEVEPGTQTFDLVIARNDATAAITAGIAVTENEENVFTVPESVSFAEGEAETAITVTVSTAAQAGVEYALALTLTGEHVSNYTNGYTAMNVSFAQLSWENIGTCYWVDNTINYFFGVMDDCPLAVEVEKTQTASSIRFRFESPFASAMTGYDEWGYYGYPYNDPEDCVPGTYTFVIDVTAEGASLKPVDLGMDWGYGMFSIGSIYGYLSSNIGSYPLGVYDEENGVIEFGVNSLYISMADYNGGGAYPIDASSYLFLGADAIAAWYGEDVDGGDDETEEPVAGEVAIVGDVDATLEVVTSGDIYEFYAETLGGAPMYQVTFKGAPVDFKLAGLPLLDWYGEKYIAAGWYANADLGVYRFYQESEFDADADGNIEFNVDTDAAAELAGAGEVYAVLQSINDNYSTSFMLIVKATL